MLGCERHLVRLVPYEPAWAELYREEEARLRAALGDHVVQIEHVGSTSVPGLHAKPILDIVVAVRDMGDVTMFEEVVGRLGYEHRPEHDMPGRLYLVKSTADDKATHHLNITELGTECWFSHVAFRDYLRTWRAIMEEYRSLKDELARHHQQDRRGYLAGKGPFITRILNLAREAESGSHSED